MGTSAARQARDQANRAARSGGVGALGRFGLLAQGFSYGLVAVLALRLAFHEGGDTADREGALARLAGEPFGKLVLVLLAVGFAANALWRLASALFDRGDEGTGSKGLGKRAAQLGRGVVYTSLTVAAVSILLGSRSGGGEEKKATAGVLGWPGGEWLVGIVGLAVIGVGFWNGYRAVTERFKEDLETERMSATEERWTSRIARAGLLARMVVFSIVGWFLVKAAIEFDAKEAIGLGGALDKVARETYGSWLLGAVAIGLLCYGAYCVVQARYRAIEE